MTDEKPEVITIDPPMSTDLDDAVAVYPQPDGSWVVDVCIADVTTAIYLDTEEDGEAQKRGFTVYRDGSIKTPMLSHNNTLRLSLLPMQERPMVWVRMTLNPTLKLADLRFCRVQTATLTRLSYEQADRILTRPGHYWYERVNNMWDLAKLLFAKRQAECGAVWDPELGIGTSDDGQVRQLSHMERHQSHLIIQELMVLTNHVLAKHASEKGLALMFRNHLPKGLTEETRKRVTTELHQAARHGPLALSKALTEYNMRVGPAELGLTPRGHWGLGLTHYAWFTSPLRRYSDIVNLRLLLDGQETPNAEQLARHLTEAHRANRRAERNVQRGRNVERAEGMVKAGKVQALRLMPFNEVAEACLSVDFIPFDLEDELVYRLAKPDDMRAGDFAMVLGQGRGLFGTEVIRAVINRLITSKTDMWHLVNLLQKQGHIPRLDGPALKRLRLQDMLEVLREHYNLPLDDEEIAQQRDTSMLDLPVGESKETPTSSLMRRSTAMPENPKSHLHQLAVQTGGSVDYDVKSSGPSHMPEFRVTATWQGMDSKHVAEATASSIKRAEQAACRKILVALGQRNDETQEASQQEPQLEMPKVPDGNPRGVLNERVQRHGGRLDFKNQRSGPSHKPIFKCTLTFRRKDETFTAEGLGHSKKDAEQVAAGAILQQLPPVAAAPTEVVKTAKTKNQGNTDLPAKLNPKSTLNERAMNTGARLEYRTIEPVEGVTPKLYRCSVVWSNQNGDLTGQGEGRSKADAEGYAAWDVLLQMAAQGNGGGILTEAHLKRLRQHQMPGRELPDEALTVLTANAIGQQNSRTVLNSRSGLTGGKLTYSTPRCEGTIPATWAVTATYTENRCIYEAEGRATTRRGSQEEAVRLLLGKLPSLPETPPVEGAD